MKIEAGERNLRRQVIMLGIVTACYAAFQSIMQALVPLAMAEMETSKTTVGLLQSLPGITLLVLGSPMARLANSRWRRDIMTGAFVFCLAACLMFSQARSVGAFVVPQLMFGISSAAFWANMLPTSFGLATGHRQARIQGAITTLQGVGYFGGPLLAGYLSGQTFGWGFYAGATFAVVGMVCTRGLFPTEARIPNQGALREWAGSYAHLVRVITRRPIVLLGMSFVFMDCFLLYVMGGSFYLLYANHLGLAVFLSTVLMSSRDFVGTLVRSTFSRVSRHVRPVILLAGGTMIGAACLGLLPLAKSAWAMALVGVGAGASLAFLPPAVNMMSGAASEPEEQSFAIISLNSSNFAAQTLLSPLLGLALSTWDYGVVYPVTAVIWIAMAALALRLGLRLSGDPQVQ